jgi:hypothetical protein
LASTRAALISAFSVPMISAGVFLGAPMPFTATHRPVRVQHLDKEHALG